MTLLEASLDEKPRAAQEAQPGDKGTDKNEKPDSDATQSTQTQEPGKTLSLPCLTLMQNLISALARTTKVCYKKGVG